jgi:hypothetical protein
MKKIIVLVVLSTFAATVFGADVIETKNNKKYNGKIVKTVDDKVVIQTDEGPMIGIPRANLARVKRGKEVFDFTTGERYYLEVKRPFLPFLVLSAASGTYSVMKFQDAKKKQDEAEKYKTAANPGGDEQYLKESKKDQAWGIVLAVCSAGTFIMSIKPMEVRIPIANKKVSIKPSETGVGVAVNF